MFGKALLDYYDGTLPDAPEHVEGPTHNGDLYTRALLRIMHEDYDHKVTLKRAQQEVFREYELVDIQSDLLTLCAAIAGYDRSQAQYTTIEVISRITDTIKKCKCAHAWTTDLAYEHLTTIQLLIERSYKDVRFFHDSVREFFAASYLKEHPPGREELERMCNSQQDWDTLVFFASLLTEQGDDTRRIDLLQSMQRMHPESCLYVLRRFRNMYPAIERACAQALLQTAMSGTIEQKHLICRQLLDSRIDRCQEAVARLYGDSSVDPDLKYSATDNIEKMSCRRGLDILTAFIEDRERDGRWEALYPVLALAACAGDLNNSLGQEAARWYERWHMKGTSEIGVFSDYYSWIRRLRPWYCVAVGRLLEWRLDSFRLRLGNRSVKRYTLQRKGDVCQPPVTSWYMGKVGGREFRRIKEYAESPNSWILHLR